MYLSIIEDYQRVIINPSTPPEVVLGLSELVRNLLHEYRTEISNEIQNRRQAQQTEAHINRLRENEQILLDEIREEEMVSLPGSYGGSSKSEKTAILESIRSQIDQAIWPTETTQTDISFLRGDLEVLASYTEKLDTRIDNQNEVIEDLSIRLRMAIEQIEETQKKFV